MTHARTLPKTSLPTRPWRPLPIAQGLAVPPKGTPCCYLIHFAVPFHHARHYLGFTYHLRGRLYQHLGGVARHGAHLLAAVSAVGIKWAVVRLWVGVDPDMERELKAQHNAARFCPVCRRNAAPDHPWF
jgi:hypothetical protein